MFLSMTNEVVELPPGMRRPEFRSTLSITCVRLQTQMGSQLPFPCRNAGWTVVLKHNLHDSFNGGVQEGRDGRLPDVQTIHTADGGRSGSSARGREVMLFSDRLNTVWHRTCMMEIRTEVLSFVRQGRFPNFARKQEEVGPMKRLIGIGLVSFVVLGLVAGDAMARGGRGGGGGRGRGGGQQAMRGGGAGQYGYGAQAGAMQRQMMQNRYRQMQSGFGGQNGIMLQQRLRDGSCAGQYGYGGQRGMQGRQGGRQSGFGGQNGMGQQQRLRDASGGGQNGRMRQGPKAGGRR